MAAGVLCPFLPHCTDEQSIDDPQSKFESWNASASDLKIGGHVVPCNSYAIPKAAGADEK